MTTSFKLPAGKTEIEEFVLEYSKQRKKHLVELCEELLATCKYHWHNGVYQIYMYLEEKLVRGHIPVMFSGTHDELLIFVKHVPAKYVQKVLHPGVTYIAENHPLKYDIGYYHRASFAGYFSKCLRDSLGVYGGQAGKRFINQEAARAAHKGGGQITTPAFTAGKIDRFALQIVFQFQ